MLQLVLPLAIGIVAAAIILVASIVFTRRMVRDARHAVHQLLREARAEAETKAREVLVAAEERALAAADEADRRERELDSRESASDTRTQELEQRSREMERQRKDLDRRQQRLKRAEERIEGLEREAREQIDSAHRALEEVAGLTAEEARRRLIAGIEDEARREATRLARKIEDEARERADRNALNLVLEATQRINIKRAVETTVSFIELPSDEMKGRIIGREGRNIRALENSTGIDLIVDDTPRSILISSFDPLRREVARVAIQRLIEDGRIHPARIEEVVERVAVETETLIEESGTQAAFELGIPDLHPRLGRLVGAMSFRTHHGQNLLRHCIEVATISAYMAAEVGARLDLVRRAALLHEIGRVDPDSTGPAALTSADLAARFGEPQEVAETIQGMHGEVETRTPEILLLRVANRISNHRPGARKENLEVFIERLRRLEGIAGGFDGVHRVFAVKAGRELRVIVQAEAVSDQAAFALSKKIARAVERDVSFQGKIKVDVVRETRAIQFAV